MRGRIVRATSLAATLAFAVAALGAASVGAAAGSPGVPTNVVASAGPEAGQVRLTWDAPVDAGGGITTYVIARAPVVDGVVGTFGAPASTYSTVTSSTRGCPEPYPTECAYRVAARDANGTSAWSEAAIAEWTAPSAARSLGVSSTDFSTVDLSWLGPLRTGGLAPTYRIEVNDDATEWRGLVAGVTGNTYRAVGGCVGAVTCAYRVRAENAVGAGDWSNVPTLTTAPSVVRSFAVVPTGSDLAVPEEGPGENRATVSWTEPNKGMPAVGYELQRCLGNCSNTVGQWMTDQLLQPAPSFSVPETCPGDQPTCTYRARALNARGGGGSWIFRSIWPFAPNPISVAPGPDATSIDVTLTGIIETGYGPSADKYFTFYTCPADCGDGANWTEVGASDRVYLTSTTYPSVKTLSCATGRNCSVRVQFVDGLGNRGPVTQFATVPPDPFTPGLTVSSSCTTLATLGSTVSCSATVTNTSTGTAPDLTNGVISSTVAGDLTGTPDSRVTVDSNTCVDAAGDAVELPTGGTCSIAYSYTVEPTDPDPIVDTVTAHYRPVGYDIDVTDSDTSTTELYQPSVNAQKTCSPSVRIGDAATCSVVVTNDGSSDSPALIADAVTDTVVGNLLGSLTRGTRTDCPAWPGSGLAPQATWTCAYAFTALASDPNPITNTVTVEAHPAGGTTELTAIDSATIALDTPTVSITKAASTPTPVVGQTVTYQVTVTNTTWSGGPALAFVTDPATRLFDSIAGDLLGTLTRGVRAPTSTCTSSTALAAGTSCVVVYSYAIAASDPDQHVNSVSTTMRAGAYLATASTSVQVDVAHPDLLVTSQCIGGSVTVGDTAIFDGSVTNTGDVTLAGITVTDPQAVGASVSGQPVTFPFVIPSLAPGTSVVFENITVVASSGNIIGGQLRNVLSATAVFGPSVIERSALGGCDASGGTVDGAVRGPGFWMTHPEFTTHVFRDALASRIDLGWRVLTTPAEVMGMYWANGARNTDGTRRSPVCQAQVQGSFHLTTAILNSGLTNAAPPAIDPVTGLDAISAMRAALLAGDIQAIRGLQGLLEGQANGPASGVSIVDDAGARPGAADPTGARDLADPAIADC